MDRIFKDENGKVFSRVKELTENIEVETVVCGAEKASSLILYFDADNPNPRGDERPRLYIKFASDGRTVLRLSLFDGNQLISTWKR